MPVVSYSYLLESIIILSQKFMEEGASPTSIQCVTRLRTFPLGSLWEENVISFTSGQNLTCDANLLHDKPPIQILITNINILIKADRCWSLCQPYKEIYLGSSLLLSKMAYKIRTIFVYIL